MARGYFVQKFVGYAEPKPGDLFQATTEQDAIRIAEKAAMSCAGAIAFSAEVGEDGKKTKMVVVTSLGSVGGGAIPRS